MNFDNEAAGSDVTKEKVLRSCSLQCLIAAAPAVNKTKWFVLLMFDIRAGVGVEILSKECLAIVWLFAYQNWSRHDQRASAERWNADGEIIVSSVLIIKKIISHRILKVNTMKILLAVNC